MLNEKCFEKLIENIFKCNLCECGECKTFKCDCDLGDCECLKCLKSCDCKCKFFKCFKKDNNNSNHIRNSPSENITIKTDYLSGGIELLNNKISDIITKTNQTNNSVNSII